MEQRMEKKIKMKVLKIFKSKFYKKKKKMHKNINIKIVLVIVFFDLKYRRGQN
jgi:hypothetical protein